MCNSLEIVGNAIQAAAARGVYVTREVFCEAVPFLDRWLLYLLFLLLLLLLLLQCCLMANGAFVCRHRRRVATNAANELTEVMIVVHHNLQLGAVRAAVQLQCQPLATAHIVIDIVNGLHTYAAHFQLSFQFNCADTLHFSPLLDKVSFIMVYVCACVARKVAKVIFSGLPGRALTLHLLLLFILLST